MNHNSLNNNKFDLTKKKDCTIQSIKEIEIFLCNLTKALKAFKIFKFFN